MALTLRLTRQLPTFRRMTAWTGCVIGLAGVASMFQPTMVVGHSMEPTLHSGKLIWIDRAYYRTHEPQRGEVVVFKHLGQTYVKRIYRTGGESYFTLSAGTRSFTPIREGREKEVEARFGHHPLGLRVRKIAVPEDHVFVLGDNYYDSVDSRELGPISVDSILGRAFVPADQTIGMVNEVVPPSPLKIRAQQNAVLATARTH